MISEIELDESFPPAQFLLEAMSIPSRFDGSGNGGGILLYIREKIPSKLLSMNKKHRGFFRRNKFTLEEKVVTKLLTKMQISNDLAELSKSTDMYLTKYD